MDHQKPTITDIRIRNTSDAHVLFYAVSLNLLTMIRRRLDPDERAQVKPGNCYIWEERSADEEAVGMGMERWTDGLQWGPSRTRDEFLFYIQKSVGDADSAKGTRLKYGRRRRSQPVPPRKPDDSPSMSSATLVSTSPKVPPPTISSPGAMEDHKLVKQTYSVYTKLPTDPETRPLRKWHLTAYYTPHAVSSGQLKDITQFPFLANLQVPPNRFKAARIGKRGGNTVVVGPPMPPVAPPMIGSGDYDAGIAVGTMEPGRYPPYPPHIQTHGAHPSHPPSSSGSSATSSPLHTHGSIAMSRHHPNLSWPGGPPSGSPLLPGPPALGHQTPPVGGPSSSPGYTYHQYPQYPPPPPAQGYPYAPNLGTYGPVPGYSPRLPHHVQQQPPAYRNGSPAYPVPPHAHILSSPQISTSSPRPRNLSLPTGIGSSHYPHPPSHHQPRYYDQQVPQYPPASHSAYKPDDLPSAPHSPAQSVHSDIDREDVQMKDESSGPSGSGLTTLVENRALPPLDFASVKGGFGPRTAEDERTLWALTRGFHRP